MLLVSNLILPQSLARVTSLTRGAAGLVGLLRVNIIDQAGKR